MKIVFFWVVMPSSLVSYCKHFRRFFLRLMSRISAPPKGQWLPEDSNLQHYLVRIWPTRRRTCIVLVRQMQGSDGSITYFLLPNDNKVRWENKAWRQEGVGWEVDWSGLVLWAIFLCHSLNSLYVIFQSERRVRNESTKLLDTLVFDAVHMWMDILVHRMYSYCVMILLIQ